MLCDSTNIENPGFSTPEWMVNENLDKIIHDIKGRLIIGTFASQLERIIGIIKIIEKYDKKLVIEGRSMKANIEIADMAGIFKPKRGTVIPSHEAENYPPDKIVVLATGAQGEDFAALMRMANKQHKSLSIKEGDTVLLSSSIIPGNEKSVEKLKDNLARQGARIVHYRTSEVYIHSTGHGNRGEVEWLHREIKPKFFMPVHGNHYRLKLHAELAYSLGMPKENVVVPDNGSVVEIQDKGSRIVILPEKAASNIRMVDGFAVGDMQEVVIRDRQVLAEDGMFVIIAMVNLKTGKLKKSPDIISRGFIYLRESQDLLQQTRLIAKKAVEDTTEGMNPINFDYVKKNLTDSVGSFLFQKTNKHPIVIPVVLGV
jgi:ribonuclease J